MIPRSDDLIFGKRPLGLKREELEDTQCLIALIPSKAGVYPSRDGSNEGKPREWQGGEESRTQRLSHTMDTLGGEETGIVCKKGYLSCGRGLKTRTCTTIMGGGGYSEGEHLLSLFDLNEG